MATEDKIGQCLMYVARHCQIDLDVQEKIRGLQNQGLNAHGEEQAAEMAELFRDIPLSGIYTDDLKRTYHTALPIASVQGLTVTVDPELRSWDVGSDLEGLSIPANEDEIKELKMQPDKVPVGGQSWSDYQDQICRAFARYTDLAMGKENPILLVLHGSGLQILWDHMGLLETSSAYDATPLEPSGVAKVSMGRSGYSVRVLRGAKVMADA